MAEKTKQPEISLALRYAEAEHLLSALETLPEDKKKSVTHTTLKRQLKIIKDHWLKLEKERKARQKAALTNRKTILKRSSSRTRKT